MQASALSARTPFAGTLTKLCRRLLGADRKTLSLDAQPLSPAAGSWGCAKLSQQTEIVPLAPGLNHLAVLQSSDGDSGDLPPLVRRQQPEKLASVGSVLLCVSHSN